MLLVMRLVIVAEERTQTNAELASASLPAWRGVRDRTER